MANEARGTSAIPFGVFEPGIQTAVFQLVTPNALMGRR
jgi:hypothetical protein